MVKGIEPRELNFMDLLYEVEEVIGFLEKVDAHIVIELLERVTSLPKKSKKRVEIEMDYKRQQRALRIMKHNLEEYFIKNKRRKKR